MNKSVVFFNVICALLFEGCFTGLDNTVGGYSSFEDSGAVLDPAPNVEGNSETLLQLKSQINKLASPFIMKRKASALVFGVVDETGWATFSYGRISLDDDTKPDRHTIFSVGSVSKVFTGMLLGAELVNKKMILEEPVENYLPREFKIPQVGDRKITLLDLATHTSGLENNHTGADVNDSSHAYLEDFISYLSKATLLSAPGEKSFYSNQGAGLAGMAISYIESNPLLDQIPDGRYLRLWGLDTPLKKYLSESLKLQDTAYYLDEKKMLRYAFGWNKNFIGRRETIEAGSQGGSGLRSSATDLLKVLSAIMGIQAVEPAIKAFLDLSTTKQKSPEGNNIGLFWVLSADELMGWHNGEIVEYNSFIKYDKNKKRGFVVLLAEADLAVKEQNGDTLAIALESILNSNL